MTSINQKLLSFIEKSPAAYHAVDSSCQRLKEAGFFPLEESEPWNLSKGKGYFISRNGSSLIAFRLPEGDPFGFMAASVHSDSPCLKIKENSDIRDRNYCRLSVEIYGGMLCSTWTDRPLSIAGRVLVRGKNGAECRLVDLKDPMALIPSVAIHMNREANDKMSYNAAADMLPLYGETSVELSLHDRIASALSADKKDILSTDLYVYNPQPGLEWGEYLSAPRLDDLQCTFAALEALANAKDGPSIPVFALFDNEEVGSQTKQGGGSTFFDDCLSRIASSIGKDGEAYRRMIANSFMVSCDNAHACHPNHPEYSDKNHSVYMNGGIVIKHNANQRYTTDAVSSSVFKLICEEAGVPFQEYANRADMLGGTTLGSIATTRVPMNTADVGLPQLAMHASFETAGGKDTAYLFEALHIFYSKAIRFRAGGYTIL